MSLTDAQHERYLRHLVLPGVGEAGQQRLQAGRVLVVGLGGLGSPAALYLAAAGVGNIGLMDPDAIELSNLARQILHATSDVGRAKTESAAARLGALNPEVGLELIAERADAASLPPLLTRFDFVLDCTDSYEAKYLINDACVLAGTPFSHCGVLAFQGQLMTVLPRKSACLRCLLPSPPAPGVLPTPAEAGVFGMVPGVFGTLQASEAVRALIGLGELLDGRLLTFDALEARWRELSVPRDPACPLCGEAPSITAAQDLA